MSAEIIITSDTHGKTKYLKQLQQAYPNASLFLNCGDLEDDPRNAPGWIFVRGNNDWQTGMPEQLVLKVGGHRIMMTHSHLFPYSSREIRMAKAAKEKGCDIVLYGHTHIGRIETVNGVLEVNPGSMRLPRDGKEPSYARMVIDDDGKVDVQLIYQKDWPFKTEKDKHIWW